MRAASPLAVCIGTGPSLSLDQIEQARAAGAVLFGCNRTWEIVPDLSVLYACNLQFWEEYWCDDLAAHPAQKWTTNRDAARKYGISWVAERNEKGLSLDRDFIHHGHGSGYSLVSIAFRYGFKRIALIGYDLKYARDYDGKQRKVGSSPRHYFGEYPERLRHWPSVHVRQGVHVELVDFYRSIVEQGVVELINSTPGSALEEILPFTDIGEIAYA